MESTKDKACIIIGASHAGVNCAFNLRKEGWEGSIELFDVDPYLPYHRPPLSKAYLTSDDGLDKNLLKSAEAYEKEAIGLHLGVKVKSINREEKTISLEDDTTHSYTKLVIATGARPIIPPIPGIKTAKNLFPLRTATDVTNIKQTINTLSSKNVVVIGGGYIGLETAASLKKLGANVTVLERETRILQRVTAPVMSEYFGQLHQENGVTVLEGKNVTLIETDNEANTVICADGSKFDADMIIVGVGIFVNKELADASKIVTQNGILVDEQARTNDHDIYAVGDCTFHHNPHYDRHVRLESVQNAVDQSKVVAASICGQTPVYDTIPWFWSDQYDVKLQMVGLSEGYTEVIKREEADGKSFSVWYFKDDELLAVDAVNNAKAYVFGTKFIKDRLQVDKTKLVNPEVPMKLNELKTI
ncbi:FAD-dependent oxidoreductase [Algibacter sp. 2305UL17-15]|uniref:NAD(P)/FAD-dependent oxidoreductase n=1 Tax=Algibacter sp. 2305UL17-15 TaxID=3231268 RepID=UPI0034588AB1